VGAAAAPVGDREDLAGGEHPEGQQRDGHPDGHPDQHIGGSVGAQRHPAERGQRDQDDRDPLAHVAPAALRHHGVQDRHQEGGADGDLQRRQGKATPAGVDDHAERAWALGDRADDAPGDEHDPVRQDEEDDQVPEAAQHQQGQDQAIGQAVEDPPRAHGRQPPLDRHQPWPVQADQPADHRVVGDGDVDGQATQTLGEDHDRKHDQHRGGDHPADPARLHVVWERRRLAGGPAAPR
jgi:hypothetical protein